MATIEVERHTEVPVQMDETGQVLLRAADICRERWVPFRFGSAPGDRRCVRGAIFEANNCSINKTYHNAVARLGKSVGVGESGGRVLAWNDRHPRGSGDEIAFACERAAYGV